MPATVDVYLVETENDGAFAILAMPSELDLSALTPSEARVAQMVVDGLSNEEIARMRGVSPRTIVNQLSSIYPKLEVTSRRELRARFVGSLKRPEPSSAKS
jgi:DNA-binding CsgD family transcriptional regulator